jgi:anti-sigma factor RsiW
VNHEEARSLLEAYHDEQLGIADTVRVDAHLATCEACREWLHERQALRERLRAAPLRFPLPADLDAVVRAQVEPVASAPVPVTSPASLAAPTGLRRLVPAPSWPRALAASLVAGLVGLWGGHMLASRGSGADQWVAAHVRSNLSAHPLDVPSSDHHTVKPWLSARLPYSPPVPETAGPDDELLGARVDYIERTAVAALVYRHGKHQVDVFVWPTGTRPEPASASAPIAGFHVMSARVRDFNAVFVSDMAAPELDAFRNSWSALAAAAAQ